MKGHLLISVLAYHFVHALRLQLKAQGINDAWDAPRETIAGQLRITTTLQHRYARCRTDWRKRSTYAAH